VLDEIDTTPKARSRDARRRRDVPPHVAKRLVAIPAQLSFLMNIETTRGDSKTAEEHFVAHTHWMHSDCSDAMSHAAFDLHSEPATDKFGASLTAGLANRGYGSAIPRRAGDRDPRAPRVRCIVSVQEQT
jgi:hypothetical protein